ncbi:hypothetical protein, partial [Corynebacterium tuberculostearicum]|uniref:hypothetical protein n=1 Tax=Corynebacterium tuberculostearicum TaxID=38304 RepID=UPI00202672E7
KKLSTKKFQNKSETGREKPETQQKNKPPQTTKACAGVQKITTKKNTVPSTRRGKNKETKKLNTITCQPIHLNAAETPNSIQMSTCSTYPTGTHQPTNHLKAHWQTNQSTHNHAHKK